MRRFHFLADHQRHPMARVALVVALAAAMAGCGRGITSEPGDAPNLQVWVDQVNSRPAPALEPLPVMKQFEQFEYSAQGLRDPFSLAFAAASGNSGPRPDANRRKQILEGYPLDSLDMVGTIGTGAGQVGLVMVPEKTTYRVRPGDYMGQSDGRVTGVFEDRIELMELVPDGGGSWQERAATISLDDE
jgi:type IV pilus assembly protein PilP